MRIQAILCDADGVVQYPTEDRPAQWRTLIGGADHLVGKFKCDIFEVERPCHNGVGDFISSLREVLREWNCQGSVDEALRAWTAIEVDRDVTELIARVRTMGIACHLATNQEPYRARYMSEVLNYAAVFDRMFYSCELGCSKPDTRYFDAILGALQLPPEGVLFIDDMEPNIAAATSLGIRAELFAPEAGATPVEEMRRILRRHGIGGDEARRDK